MRAGPAADEDEEPMTQMTKTRQFTRRSLVALVAGLPLLAAVPAGAASSAPQQIADHFTKVKTMSGEFVQFGPTGEQTGGKFYIQRPGKVLFLYEEPSNIRVVSDGDSVVVNNKKLNTWDVYPLSKTPLNLVLASKIDLSGNRVREVRQDADLTTIVMQDKQVFGDSTITMMFDPATFDLRQWTIRDAKGKDTTVMIFNVQQGIKFGPKTFDIDYQRIRREKHGG